MRILGIDPGLRVTGFGVIDVSGHQLAYVASGVIKTPTADLPTRLGTIYDGVSTLIREHTPDQAAIEKVFVNVNPQSTLLLGQARGAAICGLVSGGLPVAEYTALQLKQAVVGYGRATKEQMQEMVARLLSLSGRPGTDAADALSMAIWRCHMPFSAAVLRSPTIFDCVSEIALPNVADTAPPITIPNAISRAISAPCHISPSTTTPDPQASDRRPPEGSQRTHAAGASPSP